MSRLPGDFNWTQFIIKSRALIQQYFVNLYNILI